MSNEKRVRVITTEVKGTTITFKVAGAGECVLDMNKMDTTLVDRAAIHGMTQRIADAAALGAGATPEEKLAEMAQLVEHYNSGTAEWNIGRAAGGGGGGADALVILALMRVYGDTAERAEATITKTMEKKGLDRKKALALWAGTDKIGKAVADIKAERAAKHAASATLDADDLLADLA